MSARRLWASAIAASLVVGAIGATLAQVVEHLLVAAAR